MKRTVRVTTSTNSAVLRELADSRTVTAETRRRARHQLVKRYACENCGRPANVVCRGGVGCTAMNRRAA